MKLGSCYIQSASLQPQPAGKPRSLASLSLQRRSIYGRERRCHAGKELDAETGLYYYGARYLDPKTSRWLSGDPALGEYVPQAGKGGNGLPGTGGVYNTINLHVYHYSKNNPIKYIDPNGESFIFALKKIVEDIKKGIGETVGRGLINLGLTTKNIDKANEKLEEINEALTNGENETGKKLKEFNEKLEDFNEKLNRFNESLENLEEYNEKLNDKTERVHENLEKFNDKLKRFNDKLEKFNDKLEQTNKSKEF
jgi:RHS repeat-associated protein